MALPAPAPPMRPQGPPLKLKACIIGGGIAGLTAARALLDVGATVRLYERRSEAEMLSGPAGLGLQPNAMSALRLLSGAQEGASLACDVAAAGVYDPVAVISTHTGQILTAVPSDTADPPSDAPAGTPPPTGDYICNLTRPNLQHALHAALPAGTVTCGVALQSFKLLQDGGVAVQLAPAARGNGTAGAAPGPDDGDEQASFEEVFDLLVGADGIHSKLRARIDELCGSPAQQPVYSGYRYYRGLVDVTKLPGGIEGWLAANSGHRNKLMYGVCGTAMLYQVSPTLASFARYTPAPRGTSRAVGPEQAKREVVELCAGYGSPAPEMAAALEPDAIHVGELWSLPPKQEGWGTGCVTVVGDAAHALLPTLGQGAGQGIEDAVELAAALHRAAAAKAGGGGASSASVQLSADELAATLRGFEAARGPRVKRVYDLALSLFKSSAGETWLARLKRDWLFRLLPISVLRSANAWLTHRKIVWEESSHGSANAHQ